MLKNKKFIGIDGPDGVGKSTLIEKLRSHLDSQGFKSIYIHFPRYETKLGQCIKDYLFSPPEDIDPQAMQMLYSIDRLDFCKRELPKLLAEYDFVIVDRYTLSGVIYADCTGGDAVGIYDFEITECEITQPEVTFVLTANIKTIWNRMDHRNKDKHENQELQSKIIAKYNLASEWMRKCTKVIYVDAEPNADVVARTIISHLQI